MRSASQARSADGNLYTATTSRGNVRHTLTMWESRQAMLRFAYSGAHQKAIGVFAQIATGKTYGYEATQIPDWNEAFAIYEKYGKTYAAKK